MIEPFRERLFPHPLALVTRPLATFSLTRQTHRSRDVREWAETTEDVLWRRTKLGLNFGPQDEAALGRFMASVRPGLVAAR